MMNFHVLTQKIKDLGLTLGFQQVGVTDIDLSIAEERLQLWLKKKFHGEMIYMARHGSMRSHPEELLPGTIRVISLRMNYFPPDTKHIDEILDDSKAALVSRYALGKDYHKLIRKRLAILMEIIKVEIGNTQYRVFADSAPVMEKPLAEKAGLGWIGKHTNIINSKAGSWFFLGTIYTDLPLIIDEPASSHCGSCSACMDICPTKAIVAPFQLDARRCISYLTIELKSSIPIELRPLIGNRIYGCDDCQLVCPWNKFAKLTEEKAFFVRNGLDDVDLVTLFNWTKDEFYKNFEGSAIRRIGYECWLRNIAVALGNAPSSPEIIQVLKEKLSYPSELVREHVKWALERHL